MDKTIEIRGEHGVFLVETDPSVAIPSRYEVRLASSVEGSDRLPRGMQQVGAITDVARDFSEVRDLVVTCCNGLEEAITRIRSPERVSVEFGIKFAGEAGVPMLTKASGEATLKISVEWKFNSAPAAVP